MTATATCPDCGYTSTAKTAGMAHYALRRHSCDQHRIRLARAARVAARQTASGPEQPCTHNGRHPHGHRNRYVIDKCRCRACRDAAAEYERMRTRQTAYGRWQPYVDAQPVRDHINALRAQGMGWKRVAEVAVVEPSVLWKILYGARTRGMGPSKRVREATAQRLLAVRLDLRAGAYIDGTGTRRRLQALVALGWSQSRLATLMGMEARNLGTVIHDRRGGRVTAATAAKARALYDDMWDRLPQSGGRWEKLAIANAKSAAVRHGWVPPLAWDDDTIDDPDASPAVPVDEDDTDVDPIAVARAIAGDPSPTMTRRERAEAVRQMHAVGLDATQIGQRLRVSPRTTLRDRKAAS